ncbi:sacsin N-terminal ATP-binding-like domain-containing protein [Chryseobacterium flavum]|uniref:sacsin N-terminal ATP-binding-like domain-containing protein n=1 Tax=Chryseobacterium flavum TaxID=415851 RepID=UPI0028A7EB0D|nr:DUF3883 domain-containing protein [Chryseobacterium flavum]
MRNIIQNAIDERLHDLKNYKSLLSLNKTESDTNKGYNGRQILEMFQNCEDEGAKTVSIFFDTVNNTLQISNDGQRTFSIEGYESLLYPGLSSKVSSGYIGNKGLGFRSIINWADEIKIISNDFIVSFKEENKKDILLNKLEYTEEILDKIREKRRLKPSVYPIPLLNCGKIQDLEKPHDYTTSVIIKYKKEFEADIKSQLENISVMTLIFLNNIDKVIISVDEMINTITIQRHKERDLSTIFYEDKKYYVIEDEGTIDENLLQENDSIDAKKYSVKIAFSDDLTLKDRVLYNYFKTQIPFELPFVAHASLELDQNRNHSTESVINPFVLDKLFQLHLELIDILKNKNSKSWLPYCTIDYNQSSVYQPYLDLLIKYWPEFEVYPTIAGNYLRPKDARNLGNYFAKFLEENNLSFFFKEQIIFCNTDINPQQYIAKPDNYKEVIEYIAEQLNIQQKAKFIKLILLQYPNEKFNVLIDEKESLICQDDYVFTDKTAENKNLKVPSFSRIRFLHTSLFQLLINELDLQLETNKSRALKDKLESISDVHSFEPQTVIKKIISETNEILKSPNPDYNLLLKEFYQTVFHNYKERKDNPNLDNDSRIPCLNALGDVEDIKLLTLSDEFEGGRISKQIFGSLYNSKFVITNIEKLGLEGDDIKEIESFLKWLGVNHISIVELKSYDIDKKYIDFINTKENVSINKYELFDVKFLDKIISKENIDINSIIAWLSLDEKIIEIFSTFSITKSYQEKLGYTHYTAKSVNAFKNYIHHFISSSFNINNFLITNKKEEWFNPFKINYDYLIEINPKLDKNEVDRILSFLGAKKDFNELELEYLKLKTQELADKRNSKSAQVFYKNLVSHYRKNEKKILDVDLYAKVGDSITVRNSNEIYFSDRIQLPEILTNKFPILYFPSRSGGATAIELFGLKNLNDLDLKILEATLNERIKLDFDKFIKDTKPFILAYRLDKITKEDVKRTQVQLLNKLEINCYSNLKSSIEGELFEIELYSYIYYNDQFYIKVPENITLKDLKKNKQFIDNLSDIFLKVFDTLDQKKVFETVLRQTTEDNMYDINNELGEGVLDEAKVLLGEISIRLSVWKTIFRIKGIEIQNDLNENNLEEYIFNNFPLLEKSKLFNSDSTLSEVKIIRDILNQLSITLEEYNDFTDYKLNFDRLFQKELNDYYEELKKLLKNQLWDYLNKQTIVEQKDFLKYLYEIEHLLEKTILNNISSSYNFEEIISSRLKQVLPFINFELINNNFFQEYDLEEKNIKDFFADDELVEIRKNLILNSLSYFNNNIEYIKEELKKGFDYNSENEKKDFKLDVNVAAELIEEYEIEMDNSDFTEYNSSPWLGGNDELSSVGKKKLGINAEEIVKNYLDKNPTLYAKVEHISKTSEGEHYDLKYYDLKEKQIKFVECKYYNGTSFYLSQEEKRFAYNNVEQYEIWLVNKEYKIFNIKNIKDLGELQPLNYRVNIKLKTHAITN